MGTRQGGSVGLHYGIALVFRVFRYKDHKSGYLDFCCIRFAHFPPNFLNLFDTWKHFFFFVVFVSRPVFEGLSLVS